MKHEHTLYGPEGNEGMSEQVKTLHKWFLTSRGRNSVIMNIKDIFLTGGILIFIVDKFI